MRRLATTRSLTLRLDPQKRTRVARPVRRDGNVHAPDHIAHHGTPSWWSGAHDAHGTTPLLAQVDNLGNQTDNDNDKDSAQGSEQNR